MRIVITGASGNVGTALLRALPAEHDVVGVVRRPPPPHGVYQRVDWRALDLTDPDAISTLHTVFEGADVVVHLAWGFQPTRDTDYLTRLGVGGTSAVLQAAHTSSVGQLIHMSSVGTYAAGRYGERVDESWPTTGIGTSPYSRDKSTAEGILDEYEGRLGSAAIPIARMRPGFILQRDAASGLMRYGLPGYVPMRLVPWLPVLPLDRNLCIPLIHADDVASAIVLAIEARASGPFNLAAEPPMDRDDVAAVMGARAVHVPSGVLGALVDLTWRARLQHIDRGWLDLAFSVPLLNCSRARSELGWEPKWTAKEALADLLEGVADSAHTDSPPLRQRSLLDLLRRDVTDGLISSRRVP
ncbi:nucleoside-diphosphate sugar epimerase [Mycobacterium antarcticum]|uniref:NAD-dependent epimerase/dehydratase family protein n=1 Tax=unclassified Mycolicibacterium TaxID=2636767 RepID=UPI002389EF50|nr:MULTISPECIES: NAD-dependent epimerase/dehydratase family protein [unclassified Mycolicibacterium]GLP78359.1 nucleoside-diphosphate sugar epimerase [Mycolicibacterium sp. TUM20983]GLP81409.1 nucleoside-diphosphate sugar epimerase [Mycolicibacterium sp. TUM20984]